MRKHSILAEVIDDINCYKDKIISLLRDKQDFEEIALFFRARL